MMTKKICFLQDLPAAKGEFFKDPKTNAGIYLKNNIHWPKNWEKFLRHPLKKIIDF